MPKQRCAMPFNAVFAVVLPWVLGLGACSSGGGGGGVAPPRTAPAALRAQTHSALAATYWVYTTPGQYSALRDPTDPATTPGTLIHVLPQGDAISLQASEVLASGLAVDASLQLDLPRGSSTESASLHFPAAASSLSYMAFGEWMQSSSASSVKGGFFAFGNETPGSAMPLVGSATFTGAFHAKAFEGSILGVTVKSIDGGLTALADFGARTVSVSATNPVDPSYNLSGMLRYASGTNVLSGGFSTGSGSGPGHGYSGGARARFYGPNAEELGGAFRLTRPNPICVFSCTWAEDTYMGSFGAKR